MSQSGIPVVSQVATMIHNVGQGVGDIFAGKNFFESLGRIVVAPVTAALDLVNDVSFNTLAHTPGVDKLFSGGVALNDNPYSIESAQRFGEGVSTTAAIATAGLALSGSVSTLAGWSKGGIESFASKSTLATLGGVSTLSGAASRRDLLGAIVGASQIAGAQGATLPSGVQDAYDAVKPITSTIGGLANPRPAPAPAQVAAAPFNYSTNNVNGPAQTFLAGFTGTDIAIMAAAGLAVYFLSQRYI